MSLPQYFKKIDMLNATKDLNPELYIMHLNSKGKHQFTYFSKFSDLFKKINKLKINNRYYVHEMVINGQKRKPYLDLEKKFLNEKSMRKNFISTIKKLQKDIITVFNIEYHEHITVDDILLLDSSGEIDNEWKLSLHIIVSPKNRTLYYTNSKFTDSSAFHLYTSLITLDPNYEELLDPQVYNSDLNFRIIGSHKKFGDDRYLQPINPITLESVDLNQINEDDNLETEIDSNSDDNLETDVDSNLEDDIGEEYDEESNNNAMNEELDYLLTYMKPISKKLTTPKIEQTTKTKKAFTFNAPTRTDINKHLLECVKKYHPSIIKKELDKESVLVRIYNGIYRFDYWNRKELCPIYGKAHNGTNGFYVVENTRGYYLKCFSDSCKDKSIHIGYADVTDDFMDNAHQLNQQYLIIGNKIRDNNEEMCEIITRWLNANDTKTLAVKSPMATGKTSMVEKILIYAKSIKKILWITHRQTLTKQIYGKFKKMKFESYMDIEGSLKRYNRVIVQVDSLGRIQEITNNGSVYNIYDLVIIDEIEGNMNHYNSPYINKPGRSSRELFKFMTEIVNHAKKLLVIDADISMRTKLFIDYFGKSIIVNNNYEPIKKTFTVTNNESLFHKNIFQDLENNLNVCIISMSSIALEKIESHMKTKKINYVMHTSKTDDKLKNELEDVGNFWTQYQCVLYSPTIESGVDFNEEHFDKIYCIIRDGQMTCSQRAFLQMVGRIRKINDPNILCHYNGKNILNAMIYTYDDVLSYFRYYESLNGKKIIEDIELETVVMNGEVELIRKKKDISLFDHISIYNEVEQLNKHPDIFLTVLNKLIQRSGHKLKIDMPSKNKPGKIVAQDMAEILANIDETKYEMQKLIAKQRQNNLNSQEKLVLKKMFFNKTFGIKKVKNKEEFIICFNEFCDKEIILRRFEKLFSYKIIYEDDEYDNFNDGKDKVRHRIIFDLIDRITEQNSRIYNSDELLNIVIDNDQYVRAIEDISKNSIYFKEEEKNRALFFKSKDKMKPINEKNQIYYMRVIQSLLNSYGINFVRGKRIRENKKLGYSYSLSVDKQIKNIVDHKHR